MKKRILSMLTSLVMAISLAGLMPTVTVGAEELVYNNFKYEILSDGTISITDFSYNLASIDIPSTIDGKPVTKIGSGAFFSLKGLSIVKIPDTVTVIGATAFAMCDKLNNVVIPEGVTVIGEAAFSGCTQLSKVTIPETATNIYADAFTDTPWLKAKQSENPLVIVNDVLIDGRACTGDVIIPDSVTAISARAFKGCKSITSVTIPDDVQNIGIQTFDGCENLETVVLPTNLQTIDYQAFNGCKKLKNITMPDSVTSIGFSTFGKCESLTSINIPEGITTIESGVFAGCSGLTSVDIPQNVKIIEENAFATCTGLTSIEIHSNITSIGTDAFKNCPLKNITVDENNAVYSSEDGVLFNKDKTSLILYPVDSERESYEIPNSVETVGSNAFYKCTNLRSITIPESVVTIEDSAFSDCTGITEIKIPSSVTSLGYAFAGCPIENIVVDKDNPNYSSVDGVLFSKDKTKLILYPVANSRESYTIPNSVNTIGDSAFENSNNLKNIIIPNTVTNIESDAFSYCTELTNITVPGSVIEMGKFIFSYCLNLTSANIEEGIKELNYATFYGCENLSSIILPSSLELIDYNVSAYCSNLTDVYYTGSESDWEAVSVYYNNYELKDATVHYNYVRPETQLSANIYYQLKLDNSTIRFVTEVDIKDVQAAESGEYTVSLNGEPVDTQQITGAYKAIYANGELVEAPEGKCYVISKTYAGFSTDDSLTFEMNLSNYDKGVEREVIIN